MKNHVFALALLLCSAGALAQTHKLFGVNEGIFMVTADGQTVEAISPLDDPVGDLVLSDSKLYGVTKSGGLYGYGTIYRTNRDGSGFEVRYDFTESNGEPLGGLVVANELLWGTTSTGGAFGGGAIFYAAADAGWVNVGAHNFTPAENGAAPSAQMVESNGLLWGTTSVGGTNDAGTLFSSDPAISGYHALIHTFTTAEGTNHKGRLLPYNGFLYGVAENGGANSLGTIYKIAMSDFAFTKVRDLATADGTNPIGGLIESDGLLIGMTQNGGANGLGTIFTIDPADGDAFVKTIDLDETTGGNPKGALTGLDGVLYGLTSSEGANSMGTYFSLTADGETLEVLHDFDETTGGSPINSTLIQVNQSPVMLGPVLIEFNEDDGEPVDLAEFFDDPESPGSELTFALQNSLPSFITAISFDGSTMTVELAENLFGEFTAVLSVTDSEGASSEVEIVIDVNPVAETPEISEAYTSYLTETFDGLVAYKSYLDGDEVTHIKVTGINNGSLFDENGNEIQEGDFVALEDITNGMTFLPTALGEIHFNIQAATGDSDDHLGGDVVQATVHVDKATPEITWPKPPDISFGDPLTELHLNASTTIPGTFIYNPEQGTVLNYGQFHQINVTFTPDDEEHYNSADTYQTITVYADTQLLGVGAANGGNIFTHIRGESSLEHVATVPTTGTNGHNPNGELLSINQKHYGTMQAGGANGHGTIYFMNVNGTGLTKIHDFDGTNGSKPVRGLFYDWTSELLWGVTHEGGAHGFGIIFSIQPSGENFVKRHDFDGTNGGFPDAGVTIHGTTGKLYGSTTTGGNGYGVIYAFDMEDNLFEVVRNFEQTECSIPRGTLVPAGGYVLGVAQSGGEFGYGAIFRITVFDNSLTIVHSFNDADGSAPLSGLTQMPNSNTLLGTTSTGGSVDHSGTVYSFGAFSNAFEVLHRFSNTGSNHPTGNISVFDGRLWGMTTAGGANGKGALFSLRPAESDHDFQEIALSDNDGGGHINGSVVFVGTPPWVHNDAVEILEDSANPWSTSTFFADRESGTDFLSYALLNNTNPGLLQPSIVDGYVNWGLAENQFGSAELEIQATDTEGMSVTATLHVDVLPRADAPSISEAFAYVGQFNEEGLVVTKNAVDGDECTHFQVSAINNAELYYNDEVTQINIGDFVPYSEGALGLKVKPTTDFNVYLYVQGAVGTGESSLSNAVYVPIYVSKQSPTITWETPEPIYYGTALSEVQLNATSDIPGTFEYTPALGEILGEGNHFLEVNFTPDQPELFATGYAYVNIYVTKQIPVITWSDPQNILYGTQLSEIQLNATVDVEGDLLYTPELGTILEPGTQELTVDLANYDTEHLADPDPVVVHITVEKLTPVGTWATPAPITYGTTLSELQLNATFDVDGETYYSHYIGHFLGAGTHTLTVNFYPNDANHYEGITLSVELTVEKATPVITWEPYYTLTYGWALDYGQLNAWADVGGTFTYSHSIGDILDAGEQTLSLDFIPDDALNYNPVLGLTITIIVDKAYPWVYWDNVTIPYGTLLSEEHLSAWAEVPGEFFYYETPGQLYEPGEYTLTADFTPTDANNYHTVEGLTTVLTVEKLNAVVAWSPPDITYGTALGDEHLNATADIAGSFSYQPAAGDVLDAGSHELSAEFSPANDDHYAISTYYRTIEVYKADQSISSFASVPSNLAFGDEPIDLSAVASSGLAVVFASSDTDVISVSGAIATIVGAGTATLTASQPGNNNYNPALSLEQTVTIEKGSQVITFEALQDKELDDEPFSLSATSTSNLSIEFSLSSDKATISGNLVTIVSAGRVTVTAEQPGDADYLAATAVEQSFCITPAMPVITANNTNPDAPVLTSSSSSGNQWFLNGAAITGATGESHIVAAAGEYAVQVSVDDCTSEMSASVAYMVTGALRESTAISMRVYPNPATDEIHITWQSHDAEPRIVALYDLLGREISKRSMDSPELSIDVRGLSRGTYLILGTQGSTKLQQRFVKD